MLAIGYSLAPVTGGPASEVAWHLGCPQHEAPTGCGTVPQAAGQVLEGGVDVSGGGALPSGGPAHSLQLHMRHVG
jgi:hypothetical protein